MKDLKTKKTRGRTTQFLSHLVSVSLMILVSGCIAIDMNNPANLDGNSNTSQSGSKTILYISYQTFVDGLIGKFELNKTDGTLTEIGTKIATSENQPSEMSVLNNEYLYVGHYGANNIDFFTIGSDGDLTFQESDAIGATFIDSAIDPSGSYFYATVNGANLTRFDIDSSGSLINRADIALTAAQGISYGIGFSNDQSNLIVSLGSMFASGIDVYRFNGDGSLDNKHNDAYSGFVNANNLAVHPSLDVFYVSAVSANAVYQHSITTGSTPSTAELANYATDTAPEELLVTPNGACLYTVNNSGQSISQFSVNPSTGNLTALSTRDEDLASVSPRDLAMTPDGEILIVGYQGTALEIFQINGDCTLTHLNTADVEETGYSISDVVVIEM